MNYKQGKMNCKGEFIEHTYGKSLLCARIRYGCDYCDEEYKRNTILKTNFSCTDLQMFLQAIDYEYDNGFGGQLVFGTIWYTDGTWSERGEYDGSEWWEYKSCPLIPDFLKGEVNEHVRL